MPEPHPYTPTETEIACLGARLLGRPEHAPGDRIVTDTDTPAQIGATELLPCPFCGSRDIDPLGWASNKTVGPACNDCGVMAGSYRHTLEENIAAWNRRALSAPRIREEALREALEWYADQVAGCRKISSDGDVARNALAADGGERARAILALIDAPQGGEDQTAEFMRDVEAELRRARAKFPGDRITTIALAEEFGELAKAMLDEPQEAVWKEAVQTAVMAARVAIDGDSSVDEWRKAKGLDNHRAPPALRSTEQEAGRG